MTERSFFGDQLFETNRFALEMKIFKNLEGSVELTTVWGAAVSKSGIVSLKVK